MATSETLMHQVVLIIFSILILTSYSTNSSAACNSFGFPCSLPLGQNGWVLDAKGCEGKSQFGAPMRYDVYTNGTIYCVTILRGL